MGIKRRLMCAALAIALSLGSFMASAPSARADKAATKALVFGALGFGGSKLLGLNDTTTAAVTLGSAYYGYKKGDNNGGERRWRHDDRRYNRYYGGEYCPPEYAYNRNYDRPGSQEWYDRTYGSNDYNRYIENTGCVNTSGGYYGTTRSYTPPSSDYRYQRQTTVREERTSSTTYYSRQYTGD